MMKGWFFFLIFYSACARPISLFRAEDRAVGWYLHMSAHSVTTALTERCFVLVEIRKPVKPAVAFSIEPPSSCQWI
jgi:hypothetical protein